ncbi:PilZ domain-containing protein [Sphingomonas montanisoli]|uniref:PilZ domain-containing protein n=1 Tax=Sphingomonas montanisoli TaxID=2606412 RepID=A0A5D9CC39_9SPHN|nr:PilZ domain-containing protein [Sphingomonas montanisoli]TZG28682.1 PilZ domain-containing protein [Sphingomonas montanisoli]
MNLIDDSEENEARRYGRHRIMLAVNLYSVHGELGGVLLDISRGGAMLNAHPPLPVGCKLVIERQHLEVPAIVRWVEGNRFGIQFDTPLSELDVLAIVTKSRQRDAA